MEENQNTNQNQDTPKTDIENIEVKVNPAPSNDIFAAQKAVKTTETQTTEPIVSTADQETKEPNISPNKKHKIISIALKAIILLGILSFVYFYIQSSTQIAILGQTQIQKINEIEERIFTNQAEINRLNLQIASYKIEEFSFAAEQYLSIQRQLKSNLTTSNNKDSLNKKLPEIESQLIAAIDGAKQTLSQSLSPSGLTGYDLTELTQKSISETKDQLNQYKTQLASELSSADKKDEIKAEIQNVNNVLNLLENSSLKAEINGFSTENINPETVQKLLMNIYASDSNQLSLVQNLSNQKIDWISILAEINLQTKKIDPLYGSSLSEEIGQIQYSNFQLQEDPKAGNKIVVSGQINTPNSVNFNISSDLIDTIENSAMFRGVNMRSFNKKINDDGVYTGNFRIEFYLDK